MSNRTKYVFFTAFVGFCLIVLISTTVINHRGLTESTRILEKVVTTQIISIAAAAREYVDEDAFLTYNDISAADDPHYQAQLDSMRRLAINTEAKYIYTLKQIGGEYIFVTDTDPEGELFAIYDANAAVIADAFAGKSGAGISNLVDKWGSFSTAAMPIEHQGDVIGVVCVDVPDDMLVEQRESSERNFWLMAIILALLMSCTSLLVYYMLCRVKTMQDRLSRMANYDKLTNLPNRQHLLDTLGRLTTKRPRTPFALFFVDLDNFKQVNDNAGHDAGDSLLRNIGEYLASAPQQSTVFRPGTGMLNVAARIGGDEFVLLVPSVDTREEAELIAADLLKGFANAGIDRYIEKYHVGLSLGVALYPFHSTDYNVLIKYADIAMYHAKHAGKNCYRVYEDELEDKGVK